MVTYQETGIPFRSLLAQRQVGRLGQAAVFTTYAVTSQDAQGDDVYTPTNLNITVVISTVTNTREPFDRQGELGHYLNMHVEFFTTDAIPTANTSIDKPPTLSHKSLEYEVLEIEEAQNGVVRMLAYRRRQ